MKKRLTENDLCIKDVLFNLSDSQHQFYLRLLSTLRAVDTKQESWGRGGFSAIFYYFLRYGGNFDSSLTATTNGSIV